MKSTFVAVLSATLAANKVAGHAIFQQLWVDGTDYHGSSCIRMPGSNSPITNVGGRDFICNSGAKASPGTCGVAAGGTVTVEMHQQPGDRSCNNEAIGGAHWGPVQVYLTKVPDASKADGTTGWFKIFSNAWSKKSGGAVGDDDNWGTRDLNKCCGKMDVKIPSDIQSGDYLLRAEALALHTAGSAGGAQFYVSCYQIRVSAGGSATPATVKIPGAYSSGDPGIKINIHAAVSGYVAPGPAVYVGGTTKIPGSACTGCASTCKVGSSPASIAPKGGSAASLPTSAASPDGGASAESVEPEEAGGACAAAAYGQCGGNGFSGCTACPDGYSCKSVSPPYYSQCAPGS